ANAYNCKALSKPNLVIPDHEKHVDIMIAQSDYSHSLHILVLKFVNGNYVTSCDNVKLPKEISGQLSTFDGAVHKNHLYMSFYPNTDVISVKFRSKSS